MSICKGFKYFHEVFVTTPCAQNVLVLHWHRHTLSADVLVPTDQWQWFSFIK